MKKADELRALVAEAEKENSDKINERAQILVDEIVKQATKSAQKKNHSHTVQLSKEDYLDKELMALVIKKLNDEDFMTHLSRCSYHLWVGW